MTARDGLAGVWEGATLPSVPAFADPAHFGAWGAASQQVLLANEVMSRLVYEYDHGASPRVLVLLLRENPDGNGVSTAFASAALAQLSAPTPADFAEQARLVHDYADLRPDRAAEIIDQTAGILGYFARLLPLRAGPMPAALRILLLAQDVALSVAQQCKHALACARPDAMSSQIQPMIDTPTHSALPSGHATEAFAVAETLRRLVPEAAKPAGLDNLLMQMAARIAVNRTVAGVHFPADSFAGATLGFALADAIAARAGLPITQSMQFSGAGIGASDFYAARVWQDGARQSFATEMDSIVSIAEADIGTDLSPLLAAQWAEAQAEWTL